MRLTQRAGAQRLRDQTEADARAVLGDEELTRQWEQGAAFSLEEVVALVEVVAERHGSPI